MVPIMRLFFFNTSVRWLLKVNIVVRVHEMKDELMLLFKAHGNNIFFSIKSKEFYLTLANLVDIFKALNVLNLILQGKNINCINDYHAINAFVAKLEQSIVEFKKKMQFSFLN